MCTGRAAHMFPYPYGMFGFGRMYSRSYRYPFKARFSRLECDGPFLNEENDESKESFRGHYCGSRCSVRD